MPTQAQPAFDPEEVARIWELPEDRLLLEAMPLIDHLLGGPYMPEMTAESMAQGQAYMSLTVVKQRALQAFKTINDELRRRVCDDWDYCEKMRKYGKGLALVLNLLPVIGAAYLAAGFVTALIAFVAHLVREQWLDVLCKCDAKH